MAFKGTAGKSSSGASMSKYDVEVEARLKKLEAAVKELQNHSHDAPATGVDTEALHQVKNEIFEASKAMSNVGAFETKLGKLAAAVEAATGKRIRLDEE